MVQPHETSAVNAWLPVIATLLGFIVAGIMTILTSKIQFEREKKWQRNKLIHEKLLEIAELAEVTQRMFGKLYGDAMLAVETGQNLKFDADPIPLARLEMLSNFCAPSLHSHIEEIVKIRDELSPFVAEALMGRDRDKPARQQLNLQFLRGVKRMRDQCEELRKAAARLSQHHLGIG